MESNKFITTEEEEKQRKEFLCGVIGKPGVSSNSRASKMIRCELCPNDESICFCYEQKPDKESK